MKHRLMLLLALITALPASAQKLQCDLPDGSYFQLLGLGNTSRARQLKPHEVVGVGLIRDEFRYNYSVIYHPRKGPTTLLPVNTRNGCADVGMSDRAIFSLIENPAYRFPSRQKLLATGHPALFFSLDGGKSFSENIHPLADTDDNPQSTLRQAIGRFGRGSARFAMVDGEFRLEYTDSGKEYFLLFVSRDLGKTWSVGEPSAQPVIYPMAEVQMTRNSQAGWRWENMVGSAGRYCHNHPECTRQTEAYMKIWAACRAHDEAYTCINRLPKPALFSLEFKEK